MILGYWQISQLLLLNPWRHHDYRGACKVIYSQVTGCCLSETPGTGNWHLDGMTASKTGVYQNRAVRGIAIRDDKGIFKNKCTSLPIKIHWSNQNPITDWSHNAQVNRLDRIWPWNGCLF